MKTVLFIEKQIHVRDNFIKLLTDKISFFNVITTDTAVEAIDLLKKIKIDIVITSRQMQTKEIDLLDHELRNHPDVKLIVMAGKKSQVAGLLKAFEYKIQFEIPVDVPLLIETLLSEFQINYGGQIRGVGVPSFLQMLELEDATCTIKILSGSKTGSLFFHNGELIEAEMPPLRGKKAAFAILEMENPLITLEYDKPNKERTIKDSLMSLLLESGRVQDERQKKPKERRRYKRFPCDLKIEFVHKEWSHKAVVSNISLSGIFIETEHPFSQGDEIDIALFSQTLEKGCHIPGVVIRRAGKGIGVALKPRGINQMAILRTIINEVAGS